VVRSAQLLTITKGTARSRVLQVRALWSCAYRRSIHKGELFSKPPIPSFDTRRHRDLIHKHFRACTAVPSHSLFCRSLVPGFGTRNRIVLTPPTVHRFLKHGSTGVSYTRSPGLDARTTGFLSTEGDPHAAFSYTQSTSNSSPKHIFSTSNLVIKTLKKELTTAPCCHLMKKTHG
jgi:hypothetical protein